MDVIALGSVKHNGKWFREGDSIKRIKKEDGERLIDMGVAKMDEESEDRHKAEEVAKKLAEEKQKADAEEKKKAEETAEKENEKK